MDSIVRESYFVISIKEKFYLRLWYIGMVCYSIFMNSIENFKNIGRNNISKIMINENIGDKADDHSLVEQALKLYGNSILRMAYSYMHNMNDAEDILQDTLIQLMTHAPVFQSEEHKKAWLLRVAANLSKNKLKRANTFQEEEIPDTLAEEEKEDFIFVWEAVKRLPMKYSEVVHLFYHEGYSTLEISEILNKKEATIRSLLHRARQQLKDILKEEYDFEE